MKIPYFCCIGAELKRYAQDFDFMNQVYLYKVPTDDTIEEVLAQDYFQPVADTVLQDDILYIYEPASQVLHTCRFKKQNSHITAEPMANNVPELTPNRVLISDENGRITAGDVTLEYLKNKVNLDGTSIMTGPLKFRAGSFSGAIAGGLGDGVSIYKIKANGNIDSEVASLTKTNGFTPGTTNAQNIGSSNLKWKNLYLAGKAYMSVINNGYDLAVPAKSGTLATMADVDLAANSGDQLTEKGVWYAKMYAATVAPAAEDGTNYADFSQVDGQGNPVIVTYNRVNGAWVQDQTITPPAEYNGYVPVTSKIWDIVEQAGQQGGKVLWSHNQKTFTPSPLIISFEDIEITGDSTVIMPQNPSVSQIVNKGYVDSKVLIFDYNSVTYADIEDAKSGSDAPIIIQNNNRLYMYSGSIYTTYYFYGFSGDHISLLTIASGGTKTIVNYPQINNHVVTEFQEPTAQNNYTWYRKYADGWVEQGGIAQLRDGTITLAVTMADTKYFISHIPAVTGTLPSTAGIAPYVHNITTTSFDVYNNVGSETRWEVKGMAQG